MSRSPRIRWEDATRVIEPQVTASGIHVWPFETSFPLDVRFFKLSAPSSIALRRHDYFEILYLEEGEALYRFQDRPVRVKAGDLFIVGGPFYHGIQRYVSPCLKAVVLFFMPSILWADDVAGESTEYLLPFRMQGDGFPHVIHRPAKVPAEIHDLMRRTHRELADGTARAQLCAKTYLKMILVLLMKHYASYQTTKIEVERQERNVDRLRPLFEYLDGHYCEPISVESAAQAMQMSKSHFMRFFRAATGQPFVAHLNRFRVAKAQQLMATTNEAIAEISQEVGFCDQSYFGLIFRRELGMTPREYRDRLRVAAGSGGV